MTCVGRLISDGWWWRTTLQPVAIRVRASRPPRSPKAVRGSCSRAGELLPGRRSSARRRPLVVVGVFEISAVYVKPFMAEALGEFEDERSGTGGQRGASARFFHVGPAREQRLPKVGRCRRRARSPPCRTSQGVSSEPDGIGSHPATQTASDGIPARGRSGNRRCR